MLFLTVTKSFLVRDGKLGNIISYMDEFGGYTFDDKAFCEIDAMILAYLSYISFDDTDRIYNISDASDIMNRDNFTTVAMYVEETRTLFNKIIESRRYRKTRIMFIVNEISDEIQFAAMTFVLGNGDIVIAFRGTDDAIVGWKEDLYMACKTPVPSQERSTVYVNNVIKKLQKKKNARFYLTGHSKGGNLAVYSAMTCEEKYRYRIGRIYNFDGPNFRPDFLEKLDYDKIKEKEFKFVPRESFIGKIMENEKSGEIISVESTEIGILQHVPTSWCVEEDQFVRSVVEPERKELYAKINEWILMLEREKIGLFLDTLFGVVEGIDTVTELSSDWVRNSKSLLSSYLEMDDEVKGIFWEFSVLIIEILATDQQERIRKWRILNTVRETLKWKDS